ncbi:MAG TPA: hypothetical protein VE198_18390 [Actinoallomurus sp.]|nr:hypothetical protein [Actinoallomurus sp.]
MTYDRRGLSRSTLHDPGRPVTITAHSDDIHHLLAAVTGPRTVLDRRCAEEVASLRGTALAEFPGGHNGKLTHPGAFAERLRAALMPDGL